MVNSIYFEISNLNGTVVFLDNNGARFYWPYVACEVNSAFRHKYSPLLVLHGQYSDRHCLSLSRQQPFGS